MLRCSRKTIDILVMQLPSSEVRADLYKLKVHSIIVVFIIPICSVSIALHSLLDKLPPTNLMLLHHVFCMLHYIDLHNDENNMNARNLSICMAPSMIWPPLSSGAMAQVC